MAINWQKEYNEYVVKTSAQIDQLKAQLKETTDKLNTAETQIKEYRKLICDQEKIITDDRFKLVDLVAYKLQHDCDEKDFSEVALNAQNIVNQCKSGFLTCHDCGEKLPINGDFVQYDPEILELSDRHNLVVLCSKCAEQSSNNV